MISFALSAVRGGGVAVVTSSARGIVIDSALSAVGGEVAINSALSAVEEGGVVLEWH